MEGRRGLEGGGGGKERVGGRGRKESPPPRPVCLGQPGNEASDLV